MQRSSTMGRRIFVCSFFIVHRWKNATPTLYNYSHPIIQTERSCNDSQRSHPACWAVLLSYLNWLANWSPNLGTRTLRVLKGRSVQGLEQAIETLDAQFQACELVKIDVGGLSNKNLPEPDQKVSLGGTIFPEIWFKKNVIKFHAQTASPIDHVRFWICPTCSIPTSSKYTWRTYGVLRPDPMVSFPQVPWSN